MSSGVSIFQKIPIVENELYKSSATFLPLSVSITIDIFNHF